MGGRLSFVLLAWALPARAGTPAESGFTETTFAQGFGQITSIAWATDGGNTLLVANRDGNLRVVVNGTVQAQAFHSFSVYQGNSETGLIGLAVDPSYAANGYVYAFVTSSSSIQRVFRVTAGVDGSGNLVGSSRIQIGPNLPTLGANHDGGSIAVGPDGFLYFGVGNLGNGSNVGGDGRPDEYTSLASKIGRMDRFTGAAAPGNPAWPGTDPIRDYIFSRGWRNPFGMAFQPGTGALWVLEVGDSWEHLFVVPAGSNRGWPAEHNRANSALLVPRFDYQRSSGPEFTSGGGCLTRGVFYDGPAFPNEYQGDLFFAEYNGDRIIRLRADGTNTVTDAAVSTFVSGVSGPTDVAVGPDGALYYASLGVGRVYRLAYTAAVQQSLVVTPTALTVVEGASGAFAVSLAAAPAGDVTVTLGVTGDPDAGVAPTLLTFTSVDWDMPQDVTVSAAHDADSSDDSATVSISSTGLTTRTVAVIIDDDDIVNSSPEARIAKPVDGQIVSGTSAEFYGNGTDDVGTVRAEFHAGSQLLYTDVNATGHYHVGGGHNLWDTTQLADGTHVLRLTVYDGGGLSGSHQISVTVANATTMAFAQDPDAAGFVVIEAEHYDASTAGGAQHDWTLSTADPGFSGDGAMLAAPNIGTNHADPGFSASSPRLDYRVNFLHGGTYYVWVRGLGATGADDSVHVGLDGSEVGSSDRMTIFGPTWTWSNATMDVPAEATIGITPGAHTISVWMREDGFSIDRVVLTLDPSFAPSGAGPAESAREPLDSDGDGMWDVGETRYGLDAGVRDQDGNGRRDGLDDWDEDGINNETEIRSGTDPGEVPSTQPPGDSGPQPGDSGPQPGDARPPPGDSDRPPPGDATPAGDAAAPAPGDNGRASTGDDGPLELVQDCERCSSAGPQLLVAAVALLLRRRRRGS